jgi:hypothetical protein
LLNKFVILLVIFVNSLYAYELCQIVPEKSKRKQCNTECAKFDDGSEFLKNDFYMCQARFMDDIELPAYDAEAVERGVKEFEEKLKKASKVEAKKKDKKRAKIQAKCAKKAKDYKNESAAEDAIMACLQLEGYYD